MKRKKQSFILLVSLFTSISSQLTAQDNLGNHTATQNLDLSTFELVGDGGSSGISVSNDGDVGIGINSPSAKLDVRGSIYAQEGNTDLRIYRDSDVGDWSLLRSDLGNGIGIIGKPDQIAISVSRATGRVGIGMGTRLDNATLAVNQDDSTQPIATFFHNREGNQRPRIYIYGEPGKMSITTSYNTGGADLSMGVHHVPDAIYIQNLSGNVGIGTTSPDVKLHVNGTVKFQNLGTPTTLVNLLATDTAGNVFETPISSFSGGTITNSLTLNETTLTSDVNGEISQVDLSSIDTNTDNQMLSLVGNTIEITGGNTIDLSAIIPNATTVSNQINTNNELITTVNGVSSAPVSLPSNGVSSTIWQVNNNEISLINDGNVRIGNVSNTDVIGNYKLSIDGKLWAEEIEVVETIAANGFRTTPKQWADKVFEDEYDLKDLKEVQKFIEENGHLPEIPSEKEVKENGVELVEMNVLLLQKVEELTLYILKQQQEIQEMKSRLAKVENK